jgi:hypothetical protein
MSFRLLSERRRTSRPCFLCRGPSRPRLGSRLSFLGQPTYCTHLRGRQPCIFHSGMPRAVRWGLCPWM